MFGDDTDEPVQASEDRTVDHDGPQRRFVEIRHLLHRAILEVEPLGQLNRRALEGAPHWCVADGDVDLGAVESAVARVDLPLAGVVRVEGFRELLFCVLWT